MWRARSVLSASKLSRILTQTNGNIEKSWLSGSAKRIARFSSSKVDSESISSEISLRLWSDSGGEDVVSNPFDNFGAWHDAEAKSFLHNISLDFVGHSTAIGHRAVNEDRFRILELEPDFYYFAVFDGHGGSNAVDFVSLNMHERVKHLLKTENDLEKVLVTAFKQCDNDLKRHFGWLVEKRGQPKSMLRSGTTATVLLLRDGTDLAVASVGDSGALICRHGEAVSLTRDHHPQREDEQARIKSMNGWIDWDSITSPKVNGRLAMTRSLGDFDVKPYGVIAEPETTLLKIDHKEDAFIVLHTDGVSYVMSDSEMADLVGVCADPEQGANVLTSCAQQYGSHDNVTAIVVPLMAWSNFRAKNLPKQRLFSNMRINCI